MRNDIHDMMVTGYTQSWLYAYGYRGPNSPSEHYIKLHHKDLGNHYAEGRGKTEQECLSNLDESVTRILNTRKWESVTLPKVTVDGEKVAKLKGRSFLPAIFRKTIKNYPEAHSFTIQMAHVNDEFQLQLMVHASEYLQAQTVNVRALPEMIASFFAMHNIQVPE
jgi:hypothetical protein